MCDALCCISVARYDVGVLCIQCGKLGGINLIDAAYITDVGNVREVNQDRVFVVQGINSLLCAVADGMGGMEHGERASEFAVSSLRDWWQNEDLEFKSPSEIMDSMYEKISDINLKLCDYCRTNDVRTGTTLTALYIRDNYAVLSYSGDTRLYRIRDNRAEQLTEDETLYNYYEKYGVCDGEENNNKNKSVLFSFIGKSDNISISMRMLDVYEGDVYLICSDGAYNYLDIYSENCINAICRSSANDLVCNMAEEIKRCRASDNLSIVAVKC